MSEPDARLTGLADDDLASRFPEVVLVAVLGLLLVAKMSDAVGHRGSGYLLFVVAAFVLPLLYATPAGRALWGRHRLWLLAVQAVLTYLPFAVFGDGWAGGMSGLLGGLLLLTLAAPASWLLFGAVMVVEAVLWVGVVGPSFPPTAYFTVWALAALLDNALALFGLGRLADVVRELRAAHRELADLVAARERLRAATALQSAVGDRLAAVATSGELALRAMSRSRAQAREQLTRAGTVARQALADARALATDQPGAARPVQAEATQIRAVLAPRLAWTVLVLLLGSFSVVYLNNIFLRDPPAEAGVAVAAVGAGAAIVALQLHHSRPRPDGTRPRGWPGTLALQALLSYALFPVFVGLALTMGVFLAGSVLLLLPRRWAWPAFAAVVASMIARYAADLPTGLSLVHALYAAGVAAYGLMVYGLSRLADLAARLAAARDELAQVAALQERLRVARDVHDLLGLGLSAIALKTDLIVRLLDRDTVRARRETAELVRICARARADLRHVTDSNRQLSLTAELATAEEVLTTADVDVDLDVGHGPLSAGVEAVLATVLREAVTNVLRHSIARQCTIQTSTSGGSVQLRVSNDGATGAPQWERGGGRGLANLTARAEACGGSFTAGRTGDRFEVVAEIPLPAPNGSGISRTRLLRLPHRGPQRSAVGR
jgi:two-component system, NarL family, sensor histidine kinase DesK